MPKQLGFKFILMCFLLLGSNVSKSQSQFMKSFIPDFVGLQYAGSIGYISGSAGYHFFGDRTNLNVNYGYIPQNKGGEMHIVAAKFEYKPFSIRVKDNIIIHPINPSVFLSYTFDKKLDFNFDTDQYPKGYYFWSEAFRKHVAFSTEVKLLNAKKTAAKINAVSLYMEANTNDLYLISWFENRTSIPFTDIFKFGYGVRVYF